MNKDELIEEIELWNKMGNRIHNIQKEIYEILSWKEAEMTLWPCNRLVKLILMILSPILVEISPGAADHLLVQVRESFNEINKMEMPECH